MSKEQENKELVGRWFTGFWGKTYNPTIVDDLAAPSMLLQYSLHAPRRGHADIKAFMSNFREAFPNLNFRGAADLIAEGDYVVGRWEGGFGADADDLAELADGHELAGPVDEVDAGGPADIAVAFILMTPLPPRDWRRFWSRSVPLP